MRHSKLAAIAIRSLSGFYSAALVDELGGEKAELRGRLAIAQDAILTPTGTTANGRTSFGAEVE